MTWYPMAFTPPQLEDANGNPYSGAVIKTYAEGTSTPISMATNSAGAGTSTSYALNSSGYVVSGGNVIIPHIQANYKLCLYASQAAADANSGALWSVDNVKIATAGDMAVSVYDPAGIAEQLVGLTAAQTLTNKTIANNTHVCEGRLTLTSGLPVTISDVTGAGTVYFTPHKGNQIAVYTGTYWVLRTFTELSISLASGFSSGKNYDVFAYENAGAISLETLVWTNDTTRATALVFQDGVRVKSGALTRRYLGTFYTVSSTTTEDSLVKRMVYNENQKALRPLLRRESTASWAYTTATVRQANASAANQVEFTRGVDEDSVSVGLDVNVTNSGANAVLVGMGLDGTTINIGQGGLTTASGGGGMAAARYHGLPGLGRHYITWLESSTASGTTTWYGSNTNLGGTYYSGLSGAVLA